MSITENVVTAVIVATVVGFLIGVMVMSRRELVSLRLAQRWQSTAESWRRIALDLEDERKGKAPGVRVINGESFYSSEWLNDGGGREPLVPVSKHLSVVDEVSV